MKVASVCQRKEADAGSGCCEHRFALRTDAGIRGEMKWRSPVSFCPDSLFSFVNPLMPYSDWLCFLCLDLFLLFYVYFGPIEG